ncbi:RNA polymerase factor sigma-32 [Candidatus Xenohaliotis californiensis]
MSSFAILAPQDSVLSKYIRTINAIPILDKNTEQILAINWFEKKCIKSAHNLIKSHLKLVVKIARSFSFCGLPIMDLISEGNLGLMMAIKKFNPYKGFRLSTYAMWWIKASIYKYIIESWSLVKIGTTLTQKKLFYNLSKIKNKILDKPNNLNHGLNNDDVKIISKKIGASSLIDVKSTINRLANPDQSINIQINNDSGLEVADILHDTAKNQEELYIEEEEMIHKKKLLNQAILCLNAREKNILLSRHLASQPVTLSELAKKYSISCERVRQIESATIKKIKTMLQKSTNSLDIITN